MPGIPPYYDWIAHHAHRRPKQLAINDLQTGRTFSYAELHRRTDQLTGWLAAQGIGKGDRVALLAPNCAEYFELQFACGRLGAIMLPLNWRLTVPELEFILGDATPKLLVHDIPHPSARRGERREEGGQDFNRAESRRCRRPDRRHARPAAGQQA